jgi:uncharacterized protein YkwD
MQRIHRRHIALVLNAQVLVNSIIGTQSLSAQSLCEKPRHLLIASNPVIVSNSNAVMPLVPNPPNSSVSRLETEKQALRTKIEQAKSMGIGVQGYNAALEEIEHNDVLNSSETVIQAKLDRVRKALEDQISHVSSNSGHTPKESEVRTNLMALPKARDYMLKLVNADRAKFGIAPVAADQVANTAGQRHSDEIATIGYLSHWDIEGTKPDQGYTESGGRDCVSENVGALFSRASGTTPLESKFPLAKDHMYSTTELEALEHAFMDEKPPNDGHRQQNLQPEHNKLGAGLSFSELNDQSRIVVTQEFVDHYGDFNQIPGTIQRGTSFVLSGQLAEGIAIDTVSICREPSPTPMTISQLNAKPHFYDISGLPIIDFHAGKSSELKIQQANSRTSFSINITVKDHWEAGLYYVLIWATKRGAKNRILISSRTIQLA